MPRLRRRAAVTARTARSTHETVRTATSTLASPSADSAEPEADARVCQVCKVASTGAECREPLIQICCCSRLVHASCFQVVRTVAVKKYIREDHMFPMPLSQIKDCPQCGSEYRLSYRQPAIVRFILQRPMLWPILFALFCIFLFFLSCELGSKISWIPSEMGFQYEDGNQFEYIMRGMDALSIMTTILKVKGRGSIMMARFVLGNVNDLTYTLGGFFKVVAVAAIFSYNLLNLARDVYMWTLLILVEGSAPNAFMEYCRMDLRRVRMPDGDDEELPSLMDEILRRRMGPPLPHDAVQFLEANAARDESAEVAESADIPAAFAEHQRLPVVTPPAALPPLVSGATDQTAQTAAIPAPPEEDQRLPAEPPPVAPAPLAPPGSSSGDSAVAPLANPSDAQVVQPAESQPIAEPTKSKSTPSAGNQRGSSGAGARAPSECVCCFEQVAQYVAQGCGHQVACRDCRRCMVYKELHSRGVCGLPKMRFLPASMVDETDVPCPVCRSRAVLVHYRRFAGTVFIP